MLYGFIVFGTDQEHARVVLHAPSVLRVFGSYVGLTLGIN